MILSRVRLGITIALVLAIGTLAWLYRAEIKEKAQLAQTVVQQQTDMKQMEKELERSEKLRKKAEQIAAKHKQSLEEINKETQRLKNEIRELENKSKEVADWADTDIPDPVLDVLRNQDGNKDKEGVRNAASGVSTDVQSAGNAGKKE